MEEKKEYKSTVNLPETEFSMKADLATKEPDFIKFWNSIDIYKSMLKKNEKSKKRYILHDGPPYANGNIHIGHALNKTLKDFILKYKNMTGHYTPYIPGWDCHGLPIEHQVTKDLDGAEHKSKLEIRKLCKDYAQKYVDIQCEQFKRLGIFGDWEKPYLTMNYEYEAKILEVFKILVQRGCIEKRLKPIYWCSNCRTALAEAEVEYADHSSPSVFVKFPIKYGIEKIFPNLKGKKSSMLIWTTTPWTLPANMAIAVHPDFSYCAVEVGDEVLVFCKDLIEKVFEKTKITQSKIIGETQGAKLEEVVYSHPFMHRDSEVILADFVTKEDGTGCVHIAPGHGEDDHRVGLTYGLEVFAPVNAKGEFTDEVPLFKGQKVFKANSAIIEKLQELGVLLGQEQINHSYPHCWRCKKPIIFRATEQWFICVDKNDVRQKVLESIDKVEWVPSWGKVRISEMVKSRPDWCISRQRAWGVPIPVLYCEDCNEPVLDTKVIDNVIKFVEKEGCDAWFAHEAKDFINHGYACKCGSKNFRKENDILDVWFDSGVSHTAVLKQRQEMSYPADMYLEGSDQHRGWFQSSIFSSVAAYDTPPFKTVLTHGFVVDGEGKKMSKSTGNVVAPLDVIKKSGADIIRLWVASADYTEDVRVSDAILSQIVDAYRKIRNTCRYMLGNTCDFDITKDKVPYDELLDIDKWALSRLQKLVESISENYEKFQFHKVYGELYSFCTVDMSAFYLDILKDRLYTFGKKSLGRRSAQTVLMEILEVMTKLMAPVLVFTSEEIWKVMAKKSNREQSVHVSDWPIVNKNFINEELEKKWSIISNFRNDVLKAIEVLRNKKEVGSSLEVYLKLTIASEELYDVLSKYEQDLPMIFIVSKVDLKQKKDGENEILAEKISALKCVRCWNYSDTVGKDKEHPELCFKCLRVIKGE